MRADHVLLARRVYRLENRELFTCSKVHFVHFPTDLKHKEGKQGDN